MLLPLASAISVYDLPLANSVRVSRSSAVRLPGACRWRTPASPIESVEVVTLGGVPPQYELRVTSGLPKGSGCSKFSGYEIRRTEPRRIDVDVTHHEVADPSVICTADYPTLETSIPLGADFEPGQEYTVSVNSDTTHTFLAR